MNRKNVLLDVIYLLTGLLVMIIILLLSETAIGSAIYLSIVGVFALKMSFDLKKDLENYVRGGN